MKDAAHVHSRGPKIGLKNHLASLWSGEWSAWPGEIQKFVKTPAPLPPSPAGGGALGGAAGPARPDHTPAGLQGHRGDPAPLAPGPLPGSPLGLHWTSLAAGELGRSGRWSASLAPFRVRRRQRQGQKSGWLMLTRSPLNPKPLPRHLLTPGICWLEVSSRHRAALGRCAVMVNPGLLRGTLLWPLDTGPSLSACPFCPCPFGSRKTSLS